MSPVVVVVVASLCAAQAPDLSGFQHLPADAPPAEITRGAHYWIGNEDRMDLFADDVADKGGVHIGVGAEQNWLLIGWSKPTVAVMMDFDQSIVDLQRVYFVAFKTASTKEEFKALWLDKTRKILREAVKAAYDGADRKGALAALDVARWSVERRFEKLTTQMAARHLAWFLVDDDQYEFCRALVVGGRAFAVRGDLTADKTVSAIGAAAKTAELPVRTLYLSNAEQYFQYKKQVRSNYKSLPFDAKSVVLRTHGWRSLPWAKDGNSYHYSVQTGLSLQAFVDSDLVWDARQMLLWAPEDTEHGTSKLVSTDVAAVKADYEARQAEKKKQKSAALSSKKPAQTETTP